MWQKITKAETYYITQTVASEFGIVRWGKVVQITIQNMNNLPTESTIIATLPERFRPYHDVYTYISDPDLTRKIRLTITPQGVLGLYNYGSAITGDTNASATITYIATLTA